MLPAVACWGGAAWWVEVGSQVAVVAGLACVAMAVLARRPGLVLLALCLAAVAGTTAWRVAQVESSPVRQWADEAVVVTASVSVRIDAREYRSASGAGSVVGLDLDHVTSRLGAVDRAGRATAFVPTDLAEAADLVVGRELTLTARLAPAEDSAEVATLRVVRIGEASEAAWWWEGSERVRDGVRRSVAGQPTEPRGLVPALVAGDVSGITEEVDDDFRRSGLTHLMAVSGTNLTIVLAAVLGVARAAGCRRRWWGWIGLAMVVGFVLVARPEPSVLRAAAMGLAGLAATGIGARGGVRALSLAVLALVLLDPWLARSPGFVLSVCATAGILVLAPPLVRRMAWCPRALAVAIAVPLAAQAACTPALAALSGEVSLVAVMANLLAGPLVAPTTVLGLLGGLLTLVVPALGTVLGVAACWCARWILAIGHAAARAEGASIGWSASWAWLVLIAPLVLAAVWWVLGRPAVAITSVVVMVVAVWHPPSSGWPPDDWVLVACDVGQGDGLVVRAGPESAVVIDTGPDSAPIDRCLSRLGIDHVVALVMTHADADHVAGWEGVARGRTVDQVIVGPSGGPEVPGADRVQVGSGDVLHIGEARAEVLWPVDRTPVGEDDRNDASLVLMLEVDGVRMLLAGDVEPVAQRALRRTGVDLRADVLKVPHHGSPHQDPAFIADAQARAALVSAGADNTYGHPSPDTLDLLREAGTAWWRTDLQGDLAVVVRDGDLSVLTRD